MGSHARTSLWQRWLGPDPTQHLLFMQQALATATFFSGGGIGTYLYASLGAPRWAWVLALSVIWGGALVFAVMVRSGWSVRFADRLVVGPQIMAGAVLAAFMYLVIGPYRALVIGPLVLGVAFAMLRLGRRGTLTVTGFAFLMVAGASLLGALVWPTQFPWREEAANVAVLTMCIPGIGLLAVQIAAVHARLELKERDLREALVQIERLATHDALTGLPNRRHGEQALGDFLARLGRGGSPFALALLDLDKFKAINDAHGHGKGDEVLRRFAELGRATLRCTDTLVRWGGEEFLLLMPGDGPHLALERLQRAVRDNAEPLPFRFSAGWVRAEKGDSADRLIERADAALYLAKAQGRDRAVRA